MIIDCHIHFEGLELYDKLMADMESNGVEKFNVLVVDRVRDDPDSYKLPHALWLKALHRDRVFVFVVVIVFVFTVVFVFVFVVVFVVVLC